MTDRASSHVGPTKAVKQPRPREIAVRVGRQKITKLVARRFDFSDSYHFILALSWPQFFAGLVVLYLGVNLAFGFAYWAVPGSIANARPGSFADAFFFSIETLATVGYGFMNPGSLYGHLVATVEIFIGMLGIALVTGLVFARFSKPTARIMISRVAVVGPFNGEPTLMLRAANQRHNQILEASVRVTLTRQETTREGDSLRRFYDLDLHRSHSSVFALSWTILHTIDRHSPLFGMTPESLAASRAGLTVTITGLDETLVQTVHARQDYRADEILFGHRFVDILGDTADGGRYVDLMRFHEVEPLATGGGEPD